MSLGSGFSENASLTRRARRYELRPVERIISPVDSEWKSMVMIYVSY